MLTAAWPRRPFCRWLGLPRHPALWQPRKQLGGTLALVLASAALSATWALGSGLEQAALAWLGEALPTRTLEVRPARLQLAGLGLETGTATPLDGATCAALAALPGVAAAEVVLDLPLPLMAAGGEALLGRGLRADLLITGLDDALFAAAAPEAPAPSPDGPLPVLVHPRLLALYNATVAPSLGTPALAPNLLVGLPFTLEIGPSHLPGRRPVRAPAGAPPPQPGAPVARLPAQVVGLSASAHPVGLSLPASQVRRLWRRYAAEAAGLPEAEPPVAKLILHLAGETAGEAAANAERLARRLSKMQLAYDAGPDKLRAALALAERAIVGLGGVVAALACGFGLQAYNGAAWRLGETLRLLWRLGVPRRALAAALGLQLAVLGALAAAAGELVARGLAWGGEALLQQVLGALGLRLPPLLLFAPARAWLAMAALALATGLGGAWAAARQTAPTRVGWAAQEEQQSWA